MGLPQLPVVRLHPGRLDCRIAPAAEPAQARSECLVGPAGFYEESSSHKDVVSESVTQTANGVACPDGS